MSQPSRSPSQLLQEIHAPSSSASNITDNHTSSSDDADPVELQPIGSTSKVANDVKLPAKATSSFVSSDVEPVVDSTNEQTNDVDTSGDMTLPRWYQPSSGETKHAFTKFLRTTKLLAVWDWICGPSPPRTVTFSPFLPRWQSLPSRSLSKWFGKPWGELIFATLCFIIWVTVFSVLLATSTTASTSGVSTTNPPRLACTTELWTDAPSCGIDGKNCEPFDGQPFAFLCPANCLSAQILNPHTIGDQEVNYRPLVIGGPNASESETSVYRGDSFICGAAIHAGVVTNARGGCGLLTRQGERRNYSSTESNGIASIGFPSSFPLSFSISPVDINCDSPQWPSFAVSVLFTALVSLVITSAALFTATIFVMVFFQIGLISSAPYYSDFPDVMSTCFSRFLPAVFVIVVVYRYCIRRTLRHVQAQWERTILWLGGCWVGAMNDYTFDKIPIQRLTSHDLKQQPGAIVALIVIVVVIAVVAIGQLWFYRLEGRLPKYIAFYICIGVIVGCLTAIPSLDFRLHHYILALLLLPGTALQTRPTFLYQGLLVGLFINGVARWGFASILQTPAALLGDGQSGSVLPSNISHEIVSDTIRFTFTNITGGYDGLSVLVNDVERYQQSRLTLPATFSWTRSDLNETLFFRFAYTATYTLGGVLFGDYSKPGIWYGNGTWQEMLPGAS